jgi:hypothetical protein
MRSVVGSGGLALLLLCAPNVPARAADPVGVKVVKYKTLADVVKRARGKVVVVDFWAWW